MPVQIGPRAHPVSRTMGTGSLPGVKWLGRGADHPPPSSAEVANGLEIYLCLPSVPAQACHGVTFTSYLPEITVFLFNVQNFRCSYSMLLTIPDASTLVPTILRRISSSAWITTSCEQITDYPKHNKDIQ